MRRSGFHLRRCSASADRKAGHYVRSRRARAAPAIARSFAIATVVLFIGQIVELPGANLYTFLSNEADILREARAFAATSLQ